MRHLFIGGGGLVGSAAVQIAIDYSLDWGATSRKTLDLANIPKVLPIDNDVIYLIAAVRTPSECDNHPRETWKINADAPVALAKHYSRTGAFIVFVSSDNVEYGQGQYAKEKRFAEHYMNMIDAAIIRPGRIHPDRAIEFAKFMIEIGISHQEGLYHWS